MIIKGPENVILSVFTDALIVWSINFLLTVN